MGFGSCAPSAGHGQDSGAAGADWKGGAEGEGVVAQVNQAGAKW